MPRDPSEPLTRVSVDLSKDEAAFVDRFATYKNAMAVVQNETLRVKWKRKSIAENLLSNQVKAQQWEMRAIFKACGPLPSGGMKEMVEYVEKVLAWQAKRTK